VIRTLLWPSRIDTRSMGTPVKSNSTLNVSAEPMGYRVRIALIYTGKVENFPEFFSASL
jgi:hypothetical protein